MPCSPALDFPCEQRPHSSVNQDSLKPQVEDINPSLRQKSKRKLRTWPRTRHCEEVITIDFISNTVLHQKWSLDVGCFVESFLPVWMVEKNISWHSFVQSGNEHIDKWILANALMAKHLFYIRLLLNLGLKNKNQIWKLDLIMKIVFLFFKIIWAILSPYIFSFFFLF